MSTTVQPSAQTAVTNVEPPSPIALALLNHRSQIEDLLPEGVSLTRVIASIRLEAMKNPTLLVCTELSLVQSVARIQRWGLEIGETAFLVPFRDNTKKVTEAVAVAGYKGLIELMMASGCVRSVQAKAVFENDQFRYEFGLNQMMQHLPDGNPATRGKIRGAWVIIKLPGNGDPVFDFMSIEEIEIIRKQFSKQWGPDKVKECPAWYAVKTAIRRASSQIPKNPRMRKYLAVMEEDRAVEEAEPMQATVVSSTPMADGAAASAPVQNAPVPVGASEEQINRILDLVEHDAIDGPLSEKIKTALTRGMRDTRAAETITHLEGLIAVAAAKVADVAKPDDDLPF